MSLKDRLNTQQKSSNTQVQQEEPLKYYESEKIAATQLDSLGILDTLLVDDDLNSIFVSGAKNVYIERKGKVHKSTTTFRDNIQLENFIKRIALNEGINLDGLTSTFKFNHQEGVNIVACLPPLSSQISLFVKAYKDKHAIMQALQDNLAISKEIALVLEAICAIEKNILIVGDKSTLKTTFLSALTKKIPANNRAIFVDCEQEIKFDVQNITTFDFSKINEIKQDELMNAIVNSKPDKLILNSNNEAILANLILKTKNYKGLITSICADDELEALEKLAIEIISKKPHLTMEKAKSIALQAFDIVIKVSKDEYGRRKLTSISQVSTCANSLFEDIFVMDYMQEHKSCGVIPAFYNDIKNNSLPISDNIFDENYKHTYSKNLNQDNLNQYIKKSANIDILKKFKKDLPAQEQEAEQNLQEEEIVEVKNENEQDDILKRAQDKFDELKKNAQIQTEFEQTIEAQNQDEIFEKLDENL